MTGLGVSVVIPAFNGAAFLQEALESVYAQTLFPQEVIVVDDFSTDGTPERVASLATQAPVPLRLIRLDRNSGGPAHPINVGIAAASEALIAVLDQDDLLLPGKLQLQATALAEHPDVTLAFSFSGRCDELGRVLPYSGQAAELWEAGDNSGEYATVPGRFALRFFIRYACFSPYWLGYSGLMFRRDDWRRLGRCDERLRIASDLDLICRLCTAGKVAYFPEVTCYRREHAANACNRLMAMYAEGARVQVRYLRLPPWLLADKRLVQEIRGQLARLVALVAEAGNYRDALHCQLLKRRLGDWGLADALAVGRLLRKASRDDAQACYDTLQMRYDHLTACYDELQAAHRELQASHAELLARCASLTYFRGFCREARRLAVRAVKRRLARLLDWAGYKGQAFLRFR